MSDIDASISSSFSTISSPSPSASQPSIIDHIDASSLTNVDREEEGELDDLPSPSVPDSDEVTISDDNDDDDGEEEGESDAEREWKESLQQFELLMSLVLVPYLGKYFGRKFAYWGWKQYMEWKHPVEVVITNKAAFRGAGAVGAVAASL